MPQFFAGQTTHIALLNQQFPAYGQVQFPATAVPSADPNCLDDYEEGTWTIGLTFGGAAVGLTATATTGDYTKQGNRIHINGLVRLSAKGSSTGAAKLTGLPFLVKNAAASYAPPSFQFGVVSFTGHPQGYCDVNTTTIQLTNVAAAGGAYTNLDNTNFSNTSEVLVGAHYITT